VAEPFPEFFDLGPDFLTEAQAVDIRRRRYNSESVTNAEIVRLRQFDSRQTQLRTLLAFAPETQDVRGVRAFAQLSIDLEQQEQTARVRDLRTAITIFFRANGNEAILHMTRVELMAENLEKPLPVTSGSLVPQLDDSLEARLARRRAQEEFFEEQEKFASQLTNPELLAELRRRSVVLADGTLPNFAGRFTSISDELIAAALLSEAVRRQNRGALTADFQLVVQIGNITTNPGLAAGIAASKGGVVAIAPVQTNPGYTLFADSGAFQQLAVISAGIAAGLARVVPSAGRITQPPRVERPATDPNATGSQNQPFGGPGQFPDGFFARNPADP